MKAIQRALAKVGIVALIDEATDYQDARARDELRRLFLRYLPANYDNWAIRLPDEFYQALWDSGIWQERQSWLAPPVSSGNKAADHHLAATMALMRVASGWQEFRRFMELAFADEQ